MGEENQDLKHCFGEDYQVIGNFIHPWEQEQALQQEVDKIKAVYGDHEPEVVEGPGQLAAQGVFFKCPLVGEEVYPRDQMKEKIKEFLYSQLEQERGLTAVLIIHTCNSPRVRVQLAVDTLDKYIGNILLHPGEEKFMKIRKSNKAFQERVACLEGTEEFLLDFGFQVSDAIRIDNVYGYVVLNQCCHKCY